MVDVTKPQNNAMTLKERLVHTLLFEIGAILVSVGVIRMMGFHDAPSAFGISVLISVLAMVWNLGFNYMFDRWFAGERLHRGLGVRLLHVCLFEGGLLLVTVPMIALLLHISWWQALMMDIGLTFVIAVYTLLYNWMYDYVRCLMYCKS